MKTEETDEKGASDDGVFVLARSCFLDMTVRFQFVEVRAGTLGRGAYKFVLRSGGVHVGTARTSLSKTTRTTKTTRRFRFGGLSPLRKSVVFFVDVFASSYFCNDWTKNVTS